jgi:chromosome segregation ATPase
LRELEREVEMADDREEFAQQQMDRPGSSGQREQRERELERAREETQAAREQLEETGQRLGRTQVGVKGGPKMGVK